MNRDTGCADRDVDREVQGNQLKILVNGFLMTYQTRHAKLRLIQMPPTLTVKDLEILVISTWLSVSVTFFLAGMESNLELRPVLDNAPIGLAIDFFTVSAGKLVLNGTGFKFANRVVLASTLRNGIKPINAAAKLNFLHDKNDLYCGAITLFKLKS